MIQKILQKSMRFVRQHWTNRQFSPEQKRWEERWSAPHFSPAWRITEIPQELQEAVDQQWFPPNSNVLDIGCGSGECAAWLSQQGFHVLGIDFAASAIKQAKERYAENERLQFRVLDICQHTPKGTFQVLFDRGCLHTISKDKRPNYVQQMAKATSLGSRFLLFHKTNGTTDQPAVSSDEQTERNQQIFDDIKGFFRQPLK